MGDNDLETLVGDEFTVRRAHGQNLGLIMGKLVFSDLNICVAELVSNAYDADATCVKINYDRESDLLVVEDDGDGMDKERLGDFFRIGDSVKLRQPVSSKGRQRIGRYGVATLVLRKLARQYQLQTFCDGRIYSLEEEFTESDRDETPIAVTIKETDPARHGTLIRMKELRFSHSSRFDVDELRRVLSVEMPLSQDFSIYINNDLVKPHSIPERAIEYLIDINDDHLIGSVSGSIYAAARPLPSDEAGIYIKVRGRAVGGSNFTSFGLTAGVAARVFGVVHADDLFDIIGFDRSRFIQHPKLDRLRSYLGDVLKQVRQDLEVDVGEGKRGRAREGFGHVVASVEKDLHDVLGGHYKILFDEDKAGAVARLDREAGILYINADSSGLVLPSLKKEDVTRVLLDVVKHALALEMIAREEDRTAFDTITRELSSLIGYRKRVTHLSDLVSIPEEEREIRRMSPNRLYSFAEITAATGYRNLVLRRMVESELVVVRREKLLWKEVSAVASRMTNRIPLVDLIQEMYPAQDAFDIRQTKEKKTARRLDDLAHHDALPSYVVNLAASGKASFYVVENSARDAMRSFIEADQLARVPQAPGMFVDKKYAVMASREESYVVYVLKRTGTMDWGQVKRASQEVLGFIERIRARDIGSDVKRASFYVPYDSTHYVVGICSLRDVESVDILGNHFNRNGFSECSIRQSLVIPLCAKVLEQRARILPVVEVQRGLDEYIGVIDEFSGKK